MILEIGQLALALALLPRAGPGLARAAGAARGDGSWMAAVRPAAQGQFVFVAMAFGCLTYAFCRERFHRRLRRLQLQFPRSPSPTASLAYGAGTKARSCFGR